MSPVRAGAPQPAAAVRRPLTVDDGRDELPLGEFDRDVGQPLPRRRVLALLAAGAATLAGCSAAPPGSGSRPGSSTGSSDGGPRGTAPAGPSAATTSSTSGTSGSPSESPTPGDTAPADWGRLRRALHGSLVRPGDAAYPRAARLANPRFDGTHPQAIARCADANDVATAVEFAARTGVPFALRSGGHSYGGWSTASGLVVDVGPMSGVRIDPSARTARIGAGARLVDVYAALAAQGLGLPAGSCPTVGIAGLTLGGGVGVMTRAWGLTCDAVRAVELVTADGRRQTVDARHDPELFWALRGGGGGSFGAVTAFTVALRPAPSLDLFYLRWPWAAAADVVDAWQRWAADLPDPLWSTCKLLVRPGDGTARVLVAGTWAGAAGGAAPHLDRLRRLVGSAPSAGSTRRRPWRAAMLEEAGCADDGYEQCHLPPRGSLPRTPFAATSSVLARPLGAGGLATLVGAVAAGHDVHGMVEGGASLDLLGGAAARPGADETAWAYRSAFATAQYTATWSGSRDPHPYDGYVRGLRASMTPFAGEAAYVNYADPSIRDYPTAYWGRHASRLSAVKARVDPANLFHFPQSVPLP